MQLKTPVSGSSYQPVDIVGSSTFGLNPKILASRTFNMIQSDDWLVSYAGYRREIIPNGIKGQGRSAFTSIKSNAMIVVINNVVYSISFYSTSASGKKKYLTKKIGMLSTVEGAVFIDENNVGQIAICDQVNMYIYNYLTDTFNIANLPIGFFPGYVTYQNGRFIAPDTKSAQWALSKVGDGLDWFWGASGEPVIGAIQTKPDYARVTVRFPGSGNLLLVMGRNVSELWTDVGGALFPYQRNTSLNFDYGCISAASVATSENFIAWLGTNERSEVVIMVGTGSSVQTISTDGINNKLQLLTNPEKSVGFIVKILGHIIYQITFYDKKDNYSLIYDFTTKKFFDVTDENMNYHIARSVAFFKDEYYFVSLNDASLYVMASALSSYDYGTENFDIPKIRVTSNFRLPNSKRFIVTNMSLTMEQGNDPEYMERNTEYVPRVALSISRDGGITFGSSLANPLNLSGNRIDRVEWWKLGSANDLVFQFRFHLKSPLNTFEGVMVIRQ
jgi:hypothetical protein